MDSLEKEDISEKYKAELLNLFDRLKIENMPDVYSQGNPFSVEQEFLKQDKLFLLYVPNKKKAQFLKYLDGQSKKVTELEMQDIADYVSVLDESDIKYSTFNRYITHMHTFLQFLKMKILKC